MKKPFAFGVKLGVMNMAIVVDCQFLKQQYDVRPGPTLNVK